MLQANVFFFIASASFIAVSIFLCVAVFYVILILRSISKIAEHIEEGTKNITNDLDKLKSYVVGGAAISQIVGWFAKSKRKARRSQEEDD